MRRSLSIARQSFAVLASEPTLIILPVLSFICLAAIVATFAVPVFVSEEFRTLLMGDAPDTEFWDYAYAFAFYLVTFTVMNYLNAALLHAVLERLEGRRPSLGQSLGRATSRFPQIFAWSIVSATVGLVLKVLQDRAGALGTILAGLGGLAWSIATYFALPIMVEKGTGPLKSLTGSAELMRRTFGETAVSNLGLQLLVFLATLLIALVVGVCAAILPMELFLLTLPFAGLAFIAVVLLSATLSMVLRAALYAYAVSGNVPGGFDGATLTSAFAPKKQKAAPPQG